MSVAFPPHVRTAIATAHAALRRSKNPTSYLVEQVVTALDTAGLLMHPEAAAELRAAGRAEVDDARVDASVAKLRAVLAPSGPAPVLKLTRQQRAVIAGAAMGETPSETAARLVLTLDTIRTHRRRAFRALGARSIAQAAVTADRAGLLDLERPAAGRRAVR